MFLIGNYQKTIGQNIMKKIISMACVAGLLSSCAPMSAGPNISSEQTAKEAAIQQEIAAKEFMKDTDRLDRISAPIRLANASMCGDKVAPYWGLGVATSDSLDDSFQSGMNSLYGLQKQPTVFIVNKNSPVADAVKPGDVIMTVNDVKIPAGNAGLAKIADFNEGTGEPSSVKLGLSRQGKNTAVEFTPKMACASKFSVVPGDAVNAYADGDNIFVSKGMMRFTENDTELALVLGHELAHNSRGHIEAKQGNALIGVLIGAVIAAGTGVNVTNSLGNVGAGAFSQDFETEADYVGLYHTARAGYDISSAPNFWRRMGASNPDAIDLAGTSHPSTATRYLTLDATVKEIEGKKAKGAKLIPQEKEVQHAEKEIGKMN